jgi:hypothetical protein
MSSSTDWEMPLAVQPKPEHYDYDLDEALTCVVGLRAIIPADAFTAETLGTERAGNGVLSEPCWRIPRRSRVEQTAFRLRLRPWHSPQKDQMPRIVRLRSNRLETSEQVLPRRRDHARRLRFRP